MNDQPKLTADQIGELKEFTTRGVEDNLAHVLSVDDFAKYQCCMNPVQRTISSEPWTYIKYCVCCHKVITVYPQDRMGGSYWDPADIWETPTESNPFIDFSQIHEFADYLSSVAKDKYSAPWWSSIHDYKAWKRKEVKLAASK